MIPSQRKLTLDVHTDEVLTVEFSHSGRYLACGSRDGTVSVLELSREGEILSYRRIHTSNKQQCGFVSWSPTDEYLLVRTEKLDQIGGHIEIFEAGYNFQSIGSFDVIANYMFCVWTSPHVCLTAVHYCLEPGTERLLEELCLVDLRSMRHRSVWVEVCRDSLTYIGDVVRYAACPAAATGATPSAGVAELTDRKECEKCPLAGDVFVYSTGPQCPHQNMLSLLPLASAAAAGVPGGPNIVRRGAYPSVDVNGAIISIKTSATQAIHQFIFVTVRPALLSDAYKPSRATTLPRVVPDISQETELRLYSTSALQCVRVFRGHYSFTLKHCPFFVTTDVAYTSTFFNSSRSPTTLPTSDDVNCVTTAEDDDHFLVVSGSESGEVFLWSSRYSDTRSGRPLRVYPGHEKHAGAASLNPVVGGMLATGSDDGRVMLYVSDVTALAVERVTGQPPAHVAVTGADVHQWELSAAARGPHADDFEGGGVEEATEDGGGEGDYRDDGGEDSGGDDDDLDG